MASKSTVICSATHRAFLWILRPSVIGDQPDLSGAVQRLSQRDRQAPGLDDVETESRNQAATVRSAFAIKSLAFKALLLRG